MSQQTEVEPLPKYIDRVNAANATGLRDKPHNQVLKAITPERQRQVVEARTEDQNPQQGPTSPQALFEVALSKTNAILFTMIQKERNEILKELTAQAVAAEERFQVAFSAILEEQVGKAAVPPPNTRINPIIREDVLVLQWENPQ